MFIYNKSIWLTALLFTKFIKDFISTLISNSPSGLEKILEAASILESLTVLSLSNNPKL